ncbi:hypothetical protein [Actinoplanes awajinensis]|nr:hypothetical protein [Actinoplanes awajinensis]
MIAPGTGPGAVTGPGRPQLPPWRAGRYTVDAHLGHDWRPRI